MDGLLGGGTFWIVEGGAGRGSLARDILDHLAEASPAFLERLRYGIVEKSVSFVEEQKERLSPHLGRVYWLDLEQVEEGSLQGCFLCNEFFDAFPVHRIALKDGTLREAYVAEADGRFREIWGDVSSEEVLRYVDEMGIRLEEGQEAEVNLRALNWYDQVDRVLSRGFLLIIDYGYSAQDLYVPERGSGTLLCYYRHTCSDDPYAHVGLQDMTAHVNFTGLIRKGEALGFHLTGFVPQYQFLLSLGFLDEVAKERQGQVNSTDSLMECLTMKRLILPDGGMGDTFKVLIQHRGIDPARLTGLEPL
jgi:SAM-dependent MidA family methyltransferase